MGSLEQNVSMMIKAIGILAIMISFFVFVMLSDNSTGPIGRAQFAATEPIAKRYPKALTFMHQQPEYHKGQVEFQSSQFNLWMQRLGLEPCAVAGTFVDPCLEILEARLEGKALKPAPEGR